MLKNEILDLTERYNLAWESLNTDSILSYHAEDILYYWRGSKGPTSNAELGKMLHALLPGMKSYHHAMVDPQVQILGEDVAIVSHLVDGHYISQDGDTTNYDGALTYVYEQIDGHWKIVLIHESGKCE